MPQDLSIRSTAIPGLAIISLPVHSDNRGWFKENWQRAAMTALGLPDFEPVQNNVSFNAKRGVTRGVHAEPWDKFVSAAQGRFFGAWVDLREGPSFGTVVTAEVDEATAVFVPRGVGNAYQTLTDNVSYSYLVNEHWSAAKTAQYAYVNLADPALAIGWPIPLAEAELSDKDKAHPFLAKARKVRPRRPLILGAKGQLGRALAAVFPEAAQTDLDELDLADPEQLAAWPWADFDIILNAAAWTAVDAAETAAGRRSAWQANAAVPAALAKIALAHRQTLVHVSSDYVFDGTHPLWREDDGFAPLSVYGQAKAAGDLAVSVVPRHYILRTSWVVGDGRNFIAVMADLARRGANPAVVGDQTGRLTHTANLAAAIKHLLDSNAPYGTYNCTDGGPAVSWADVARGVFAAAGRDPADVRAVTTAEYYAGKEPIAPRPLSSLLDLAKLEATGYAVPEFPLGQA
ncbi:MAG: bifunctional dTDP-4-dehydrorhamnose 3,5-epimerase family protein/NAD(P)-dependent oxidoreductase [Propionibacteriaceae bacterium]|jgi:dTDP-4-dehydrorhamnose 3,5-epimerase|nr:bifunctional dTDP-4-dehydrorhamnose 3,5-epimerase family protein/NAD(P)-dependent oxidoreductase [Propionibacteriaceae bacterium]